MVQHITQTRTFLAILKINTGIFSAASDPAMVDLSTSIDQVTSPSPKYRLLALSLTNPGSPKVKLTHLLEVGSSQDNARNVSCERKPGANLS